MAEYIDREAFLKSVLTAGIGKTIAEYSESDIGYMIRKQPASDVAPVKHGKWLYNGHVCGDTAYKCSACGEIEWRTSCDRLKYCPFCGAKMDGGDNV